MKRGINTKSSRKSELTKSTTSESGKFDCDLNCRRMLNAMQLKDNIIDHLDFTKDRRILERGYMSDSNINLCRCELRNQHSQTSNTFDTLNARNKINVKCSKCTSCNLRDLSDFRSYNYQETHAPKTITDTIKIPVHTCIYPYELNDRLFAKNSFGDETSRCSICDLPLVTGVTDFFKKPGSGIQNFEWEYIKKREVLRKRMENYVPQMAVIQIPICVKEPNHSVIPQRSGRNINQSSGGQLHRLNVSLGKKIYPRDSLALRFQKGMI
ncbi:uncharacterized protein LOC123301736 [Chrysoperla carnea]|uniref:uncharacterized protein LOC123301736 n=1 Tax=Chrysoperla carnea TaxID=189513 RepID=UPI001D071D43|nr:uncharacterized protein LOC123301736 [Chrysoperla carnea]